MKELKRALSLAMATVMSMGMMAVSAGASGYADVDASHNNEAIAVMQAAGIMVGDDQGNFNPDAPVTRQEMAVVMCDLLGLDHEDYKDSCHFVDVSDWAKGYVAACYANDIVAGVSDTEYNAKGVVTVAEAALMMQNALGYFEHEEEFQGNWKTASMNNATRIKLLNGLSNKDKNAALTRNDIAQLTLNTLESELVDFTGDLGFKVGDVQMGFRAEYTAEKADQGKHYNGNDDEKLQLIEKLYNFKLTVERGNDAMGHDADVWSYGKNTEFYKASLESNQGEVVTHFGTAYDTVGEVLAHKNYFNLKDNSDIDLGNDNNNVADWTLYINGEKIEANQAAEAVLSGDVIDVYETDGVVTNVVISRFTTAKVKDVDTDVKDADAENGVSAYVSLVDLDGRTVGKNQYNDTEIVGFAYEKGDVIAVAINADDESINASYKMEAIRGQVSAYSASKHTLTINGEQRSISGNVNSTVNQFAYNSTEYVAYVDANGLILGIDGVEAIVGAENVFYVAGAYYTTSVRGNNYYAVVVDLEGNLSEIELEKTAYMDTLGKSGNADTFYAIGRLYEFSDSDTVAVNGENFGGDTATAAAKSGNDKYSVKAYAGDGKNLFVSSVYDNKLNGDLAEDAKSVILNNDKYYLDDDTKYIVVEGNNTDLEVTVSVGGLNFADKNNEKILVMYEKSGTSKVANTVILAAPEVEMGIVESQIAYIAEKSEIQVGSNAWQADLYLMDGTVLEGVSINKEIDQSSEIGFYRYSVNENGIYELSAYNDVLYSSASTSDYTYKDATGAMQDVMIHSIYRSSKLTLVDVAGQDSKKGVFEDVALSDKLVVMDAREALGVTLTQEPYTKTIDTLAKLEAAMEKATLTVDTYFVEGEVTMIVVNSMASNNGEITEIVAAKGDATSFELSDDTYVLTVSAAEQTGTLTLTVAEGAEVTGVESSDETKATVEETSDNVITVTAKANGTTDLTVEVTAADGITVSEYTVKVKVEGIS